MNSIGLYLMSALYLFTGISHFVKPRMYMRIMPHPMPWHAFFVYFTGVWEMLAAILLLPLLTRPYAAWAIIVLLIVVFPANIQMAIDYKKYGNPWFWATLVRLPLQALLIWWAWKYTSMP